MSVVHPRIREGDLYRVYEIGGRVFEICYGYYSEAERESDTDGENLMPIFPDFYESPEYADSGYPFCVDIEEPCGYYKTESPKSADGWCRDCVYFPKDKPKLGVCRCDARRIIVAENKGVKIER